MRKSSTPDSQDVPLSKIYTEFLQANSFSADDVARANSIMHSTMQAGRSHPNWSLLCALYVARPLLSAAFAHGGWRNCCGSCELLFVRCRFFSTPTSQRSAPCGERAPACALACQPLCRLATSCSSASSSRSHAPHSFGPFAPAAALVMRRCFRPVCDMCQQEFSIVNILPLLSAVRTWFPNAGASISHVTLLADQSETMLHQCANRPRHLCALMERASIAGSVLSAVRGTGTALR